MADELVAIAQAAGVQDMVAADHDGVVEGAAACETGLPQAVDLVEQAESARPAELGLEGRRIKGEADRSWRRIIGLSKSISKLIEKPRSGNSAADAPSSITLTGFNTLMPRRAASCSTIPAHSIRNTNGAAAPVHDRHFGPIELDDGVVDLGAGERRHQMLDSADAGSFAVRQRGAERRLDV